MRFLALAQNDLFKKHSLIVFFYLVLFLWSFAYSVNAQSLSQLELNYQKIAQTFNKEYNVLDSLNIIYTSMITEIEKAKQKDSPNNDKIAEMLAEAVVISNLIKEKQVEVDKTVIQFDQIKKKLDQAYTIKIDSLKMLKNSKSFSDDKKQLQSQIMTYIEKRLLVSPQIHSLSFDPQKLIQYQPSTNSDSLEDAIYNEYLANALKETEKQSQELTLLIDEIEDVIVLKNETSDFIDDVNSEMMFNPAFQSTQQGEKNDNVFLGGTSNRIEEDFSSIYSQANSYLYIFNQLRSTITIDAQSSWHTPTDTIPANLTFQQYLDLLQVVKKMLEDYRTLLEHKMESH